MKVNIGCLPFPFQLQLDPYSVLSVPRSGTQRSKDVSQVLLCDGFRTFYNYGLA